ncbi:unnamed protein product [Leuciscus chuanchicus]
MDQNEKLVMFGVTHVLAVDGFSKKVVGHATMPVKNNLTIYEQVYREDPRRGKQTHPSPRAAIPSEEYWTGRPSSFYTKGNYNGKKWTGRLQQVLRKHHTRLPLGQEGASSGAVHNSHGCPGRVSTSHPTDELQGCSGLTVTGRMAHVCRKKDRDFTPYRWLQGCSELTVTDQAGL